jgi:hypothetical protein
MPTPDWASGIGAGKSTISPAKTAVAFRGGFEIVCTPRLAEIRSLIGTRLTSSVPSNPPPPRGSVGLGLLGGSTMFT